MNEEIIKGKLKELVRSSVEETLNNLLEQEAKDLTAAKYERTEGHQEYRSGHYDRNLTTTSGDVTLKMPRLSGCTEMTRKKNFSCTSTFVEIYKIFKTLSKFSRSFLAKGFDLLRCALIWRLRSHRTALAYSYEKISASFPAIIRIERYWDTA